jgi:8-oxo-dGTP diphosphatase
MASAVFVLYRDGLVLMEQRPETDAYFPGEWLFPAGKVEDGETPHAAMHRELGEELGVLARDWQFLGVGRTIYYARPGQQSHRMYPALVTRWDGEVPDAVLDSGAPLAWRTLAEATRSPVEHVQQIALAVGEVSCES